MWRRWWRRRYRWVNLVDFHIGQHEGCALNGAIAHFAIEPLRIGRLPQGRHQGELTHRVGRSFQRHAWHAAALRVAGHLLVKRDEALITLLQRDNQLAALPHFGTNLERLLRVNGCATDAQGISIRLGIATEAVATLRSHAAGARLRVYRRLKPLCIRFDEVQLDARLVIQSREDARVCVAVVGMAQNGVLHLDHVHGRDAAARHLAEIDIEGKWIGEVEADVSVLAPASLLKVANQVCAPLSGDSQITILDGHTPPIFEGPSGRRGD